MITCPICKAHHEPWPEACLTELIRERDEARKWAALLRTALERILYIDDCRFPSETLQAEMVSIARAALEEKP
jgi:hypothetical protein